MVQELANADKDRVAKVKADLPPVAKQPKAAKEAKAEKVPRAKTAYLVRLLTGFCVLQAVLLREVYVPCTSCICDI